MKKTLCLFPFVVVATSLTISSCSSGPKSNDSGQVVTAHGVVNGVPDEAKPNEDTIREFLGDITSGNSAAAAALRDAQDTEPMPTVELIKAFQGKGSVTEITYDLYNSRHSEGIPGESHKLGGTVTMSDGSKVNFEADQNQRSGKWLISEFALTPSSS